MSFFRPQLPPAFGLALSDRSIKIVQVTRRGTTSTVEAITTLSLPNGSIANGDIANMKAVTQTLAAWLDGNRRKLASGVVVALPEVKTFLQTITIGKDGAPFADRLRDTLPAYLPLTPEEAYIDSAILSETTSEWHVLVGAAPRELVDNYIQLLEGVDLIPLAIDFEALAITRAAIAPNTPKKTRAIIDLGGSRATLILHTNDSVALTASLAVAGDAVTAQIAKALDLSQAQAEKAKLACGLDQEKCEGAVRLVLESMVQELLNRLQESRTYYLDHTPDAKDIEEVLLCGGGAYLEGLDRILSQALQLPVARIDLTSAAKFPTTHANESLSYTTALGLALRGADESAIL